MPWSATGIGPFCPVNVSDGLTLDFDQADSPFPVLHYCFRVGETEFDGIVGRLAARGIAYRSTPHGPADMRVNTEHGRILERTGRPCLGSADGELRPAAAGGNAGRSLARHSAYEASTRPVDQTAPKIAAATAVPR